MTNLETVGNPQQAAAARGSEKPVVQAQEPESAKPVDQGERVENRTPAPRVEAPARSFQARLNYDNDAEEVIIEILNPQTGDVITRIPAEELPDDIRTLITDSGPLVETIA